VAVELLHVGFHNVVAAKRVVAILGPSSAPVKRMVHEASEQHMIIDATSGRKTKSVIILDTGHVVLAALQPDTISGRLSPEQDADAMPSETAHQ
jgi:regulator of extracellular matrix RemA (YlzA/DUF370 family)